MPLPLIRQKLRNLFFFFCSRNYFSDFTWIVCLFIKVKGQSWLNWLGQISLALIAGLMMLYANFQGISSLIRTEPVTRNLIAPANVLSSTYKALVKESPSSAPRVREVIDPQPSLGKTHNGKKGCFL